MSKTHTLASAMAAVGLAMMLPGPGQAREQQPDQPTKPDVASPDGVLEGASVMLKVDGMSCPFCAYGLEKRLKELPAVDAVQIRVGDGVVQIRTKDGQSLADDALNGAVEKAGFTLREIHRVDH
ncbi:MAG: heavy-metal-associated domain-containing protein [Gemmatimonadota bacterium]